MRVTEHCHRVPRAAVESPSSGISRGCPDTVLGNWRWVTPPEQGLCWRNLRAPFQPQQGWDSGILRILMALGWPLKLGKDETKVSGLESEEPE